MTMLQEDSIRILSDITGFMKYSKYRDELTRRETWNETTERNQAMHKMKYQHLGFEFLDEINTAYGAVYEKRVLPSMRSMQFAGRPIELTPSRIYNCAYMPIEAPEAFAEAMFLLLGGTGVGYSVQEQHVACLPPISRPTKTKRFVVADSIEGWADAVKVLVLAYLDSAKDYKPVFDVSEVRPKGARLITSGGKAPGPEPLLACLRKLEAILDAKASGDRLLPIEAHDMVCIIADAVLAGGIRRAALISLLSLTDKNMLLAKGNFSVVEHGPIAYNEYCGVEVTYDDPAYGLRDATVYLSNADKKMLADSGTLPWFHFHPHRGRANNSVCLLRGSVSKKAFKVLWKVIQASGCGEPGIYWTHNLDWGTNPCCEIALRPYQFCNLSTINARLCKTQGQLDEAVRCAAFLGTLAAGYTDFQYLRPIWKETTEHDALLGVSMTGVAEATFLGLDFERAAKVVLDENLRVADIIGINPAARTTAIKPEGTSSLVLGTSSGVHAWHNDFYIRRIRVKKNEAIYLYLLEALPELVEDDQYDPNGAIICIPVKAPEGAITRHESALDLLARVKLFSEKWVKPGHRDGDNTHNVSATITVKDDEWAAVGDWFWDNQSVYNGLSVLPHDGGTYVQAPFTDCTEAEYEAMSKFLKAVDLTKVNETYDETNLTGELACAGGHCTI